MLKKDVVIRILFLVSLAGFIIFALEHFQLSPSFDSEITPKSSSDEPLSWIALSTAVVSFLTALVGLIQKIIEAKGKNASS